MAKGHENLVSLADRTTDEQRAIATMGGVASGKARREKKSFREAMEILLEQLVERKDKDGNILEKIPRIDAICLKQIEKALTKGDTKAAKFCVDVVTPKRLEITGADGRPLEQAVRYVDPKEYKEVQDHIDQMVGDTNDD
jgi:hypothetical protein